MRARRPSIPRTDSGSKAINATPLIDVVMCLIVFYLMVGTLAGEKLAAVDLPEATLGQRDPDAKALVINIPLDESDGAIVVKGQSVDEGELVRLVTAWLADEGAEDPGRPGSQGEVEIRASRRVSFRRVAPALRACDRAGAGSVRLVAEEAR